MLSGSCRGDAMVNCLLISYVGLFFIIIQSKFFVLDVRQFLNRLNPENVRSGHEYLMGGVTYLKNLLPI